MPPDRQSTCAARDGVTIFTVWPSWLAAVPRNTARIRSPSRSASGNRLSNITTQPSPATNPSAATSNAWHRPVADSIPMAEPEQDLRGSSDHRGAARQGYVAFAVMQAATGHMHRRQAGRARGIHRHRRTVQPHRVGDPPGAHGEAIAHVPVRPLQCVGLGVHELVVVMHQPHEHAGPRVGQRVRGQSAVFHCLPGGFQQQAVLRIHRGRFVFGDAEELGIEAGDVIEERAPLTHRPSRRPGWGS